MICILTTKEKGEATGLAFQSSITHPQSSILNPFSRKIGIQIRQRFTETIDLPLRLHRRIGRALSIRVQKLIASTPDQCGLRSCLRIPFQVIGRAKRQPREQVGGARNLPATAPGYTYRTDLTTSPEPRSPRTSRISASATEKTRHCSRGAPSTLGDLREGRDCADRVFG